MENIGLPFRELKLLSLWAIDFILRNEDVNYWVDSFIEDGDISEEDKKRLERTFKKELKNISKLVNERRDNIFKPNYFFYNKKNKGE